MDDLVKRLRAEATHWERCIEIEAADRIEQLERELAVMVKAQEANLQSLADTEAELAAEKALADRLAEDLDGYREAIDPDCKDHCCQYARETEAVLAAYRKARGL